MACMALYDRQISSLRPGSLHIHAVHLHNNHILLVCSKSLIDLQRCLQSRFGAPYTCATTHDSCIPPRASHWEPCLAMPTPGSHMTTAAASVGAQKALSAAAAAAVVSLPPAASFVPGQSKGTLSKDCRQRVAITICCVPFHSCKSCTLCTTLFQSLPPHAKGANRHCWQIGYTCMHLTANFKCALELPSAMRAMNAW